MSRARDTAGSLRVRVTAAATLAVVVVLVLAAVGLVAAQRAALLESLDETLAQQADAVAADLRSGSLPDRQDLLSDDVAVQVAGPGGAVSVGVPPDGELRRLTRDVDGRTVRVVGGLDDVAESTAALAGALAVAIPLAAFLLAVVVWTAVGRALRPVEDLRAEVDAMSAHRLDARVPEPAAPREIARLARTMNAMLSRLQRATEQQRQFVADASHELRSPLARMRAELEVDRAHPASADTSATAASVLAETLTLQRLVDDLLLLARDDAAAPVPDGRPVDLDEVVRAAAAARRGTAHAVDLSGIRPVQVRGDPEQLARAVANLLDNAVRHADHRVSVVLGEAAGSAVLVVADDGPGIPAAERERVFERFTRLDDARSSDTGGAGLGLAIARAIAARHGGTLTAEPAERGARLVLRLPAAPL
jgi:signal transduction histidine kinase